MDTLVHEVKHRLIAEIKAAPQRTAIPREHFEGDRRLPSDEDIAALIEREAHQLGFEEPNSQMIHYIATSREEFLFDNTDISVPDRLFSIGNRGKVRSGHFEPSLENDESSGTNLGKVKAWALMIVLSFSVTLGVSAGLIFTVLTAIWRLAKGGTANCAGGGPSAKTRPTTALKPKQQWILNYFSRNVDLSGLCPA
jgi:hypothetical protein